MKPKASASALGFFYRNKPFDLGAISAFQPPWHEFIAFVAFIASVFNGEKHFYTKKAAMTAMRRNAANGLFAKPSTFASTRSEGLSQRPWWRATQESVETVKPGLSQHHSLLRIFLGQVHKNQGKNHEWERSYLKNLGRH